VPELTVLRVLVTMLRLRLADMRNDERGSPTIETVLIAAGLAAAAIAAVTIIALKVTSKANNIPTGP
jgi:Flp pilus assembly pilin Flp